MIASFFIHACKGDNNTKLATTGEIDVVDIAKDGQSIKSVIHMPTGLTKRFRGLRLGPDNALYAAVDEGEIYKITATAK